MVFNTYKEYVYIKYKSNVCSKATLFNFVAFCLTVIPSYMIAYRTQGFWIRLETFREMPKVQFKHQVMCILETQHVDDGRTDFLAWTNIPGLSSMLSEKATPFIQSSEGPIRYGAAKQFLDFEITIPLQKKQNVLGVHLLLLFEYEFSRQANMVMESMAYLSFTSGKSANLFESFADLRLVQKQPLWALVRDDRFNYPVIPRNSKIAKDYSLSKIFENYVERNVSTTLMNKYELWSEDLKLGNQFMIRSRINYVEESYECWASPFNALKWAWIQYLSIFTVLVVLVRRVQRFVYESRFFETIQEVPKLAVVQASF